MTPFGNLIATPARGTLMGNRGRLHDATRRIVRRVVPSYRAWVTCRLEFRGRRRPVMAPNRYTELFFLDEATALAAGHRPCGECRRSDLWRFRTAWLRGNPERGVPSDALTEAIDRELDRDRLGADRRPVTYLADVSTLPDGAFVVGTERDEALLLWRGALIPWSPEGYGAPRPRAGGQRVIVLTPRSTVAAIAAGYEPVVHPTADATVA